MTSAVQLLRAGRSAGLLQEPLEELLAHARRLGSDPLAVACERERLPREAFYRALAQTRGLDYAEAQELVPEAEVLAAAPRRLLVRKQVLPLRRAEGRVRVATSDPDDAATLDGLRRIYGQLELALAEPQVIGLALRRAGIRPEGEGQALDAVAFLDDLLHQAWLRRASDLHLDPQPEGLVVRLRVDGELIASGAALGEEEAASLVSRVKVLAGLDIAERRLPQDGSFNYTLSSEEVVDIRVATIPTRHGERATLRLLGIEGEELTIERLGLRAQTLGRLRESLSSPHGMVLLTGPTGSGKTTTLYAALREIAAPQRNVMTVEDPVERVLAGVSQVQVGAKVSFARALRALLRHDPDVLMVGEIRDAETADVAVKAAMTGHMVLSSLHANRAAGAPARLIDLGCERFLVASVLRAALAQRLARRLCPHCRQARPATPVELAALGAEEPFEVQDPGGCPVCVGTGYRGRLALVEALWIDDQVSALIEGGASEEQLRKRCASDGLGADALNKVRQGLTSVSEALRVRI